MTFEEYWKREYPKVPLDYDQEVVAIRHAWDTSENNWKRERDELEHQTQPDILRENTELKEKNRKLETVGISWGENLRDGKIHEEWHWSCGCALHPVEKRTGELRPHIHHCAAHAIPPTGKE